jgi:hypothetical protein
MLLFSSTKSEMRAQWDLLGIEGGRGEKVGRGTGWRNHPKNVCTCD